MIVSGYKVPSELESAVLEAMQREFTYDEIKEIFDRAGFHLSTSATENIIQREKRAGRVARVGSTWRPINIMTTAEAMALLKIAESRMISKDDVSEYSAWLELGHCQGDLRGATQPTVSASARSSVVRRGYASQADASWRFDLTPRGQDWCRELAAVSCLVRGLRRLGFDFE